METKILIVDDEAAIGEMVSDILEEYGFETRFVSEPGKALEAMDSFKPSVALVDYQLGKMTGLELTQALKAKDADLPVILMTAYPSLDLAVQSIKENIYDFISKPIDRIYLARCVAKALENRHLVEENKLLVQNLKVSNASLELANQMKSKFLSIVTHDLRTPLTAIRGFCEMLRTEQNLSKDESEKCMTMIEKSVSRMNSLVVSLMDMVSIEAGKLRIEKKTLDYLGIVRELDDTFVPISEKKEVKLTWEIPAGNLMVEGDSGRLHQVLMNLVSNALKHTPRGGRVAVTVSVNGGKIMTEVRDNGEGIAAENQLRIFHQFFQVDSSPHKREGLGLGLAIAKEIVNAHGGDIGASSPGLGQGSVFYFTLPSA